MGSSASAQKEVYRSSDDNVKDSSKKSDNKNLESKKQEAPSKQSQDGNPKTVVNNQELEANIEEVQRIKRNKNNILYGESMNLDTTTFVNIDV